MQKLDRNVCKNKERVGSMEGGESVQKSFTFERKYSIPWTLPSPSVWSCLYRVWCLPHGPQEVASPPGSSEGNVILLISPDTALHRRTTPLQTSLQACAVSLAAALEKPRHRAGINAEAKPGLLNKATFWKNRITS